MESHLLPDQVIPVFWPPQLHSVAFIKPGEMKYCSFRMGRGPRERVEAGKGREQGRTLKKAGDREADTPKSAVALNL